MLVPKLYRAACFCFNASRQTPGLAGHQNPGKSIYSPHCCVCTNSMSLLLSLSTDAQEFVKALAKHLLVV